jgi:hypothetical protein
LRRARAKKRRLRQKMDSSNEPQSFGDNGRYLL